MAIDPCGRGCMVICGFLGAGTLLLGLLAAPQAQAQDAGTGEPAACKSTNPASWPPPSKPYFMIVVDTSSSMDNNVSNPNSCGYSAYNSPNGGRIDHARCAVKKTVQAFSEVNFGLASYAKTLSKCNASCNNFTNCVASDFPRNGATTQATVCPSTGGGCGPAFQANPANRQGANILTPMLQDAFWNPPPPPASNVGTIVSYADNDCTNSKELFANGCTPLNGALRDMYRYFQNGWTAQPKECAAVADCNGTGYSKCQTDSVGKSCGCATDADCIAFGGGKTKCVTLPDGAKGCGFPSPLGTIAQGERPCRSVNIILLTDGDETCDAQADAESAADALYNLTTGGVTFGGNTWHIRTHVINFAGASKTDTDNIAIKGGTGTSYLANNEADLSAALANIVGNAIKPEVCDNTDNNCNGCTDEGSFHYCDQQQNCCVWNTDPQRATCLAQYQASIGADGGSPQGDLTKLPCTSPQQQQNEPAHWLCYDPKESCEDPGVDNNCNGTIDENVKRCGNPPHCAKAETCNGQDDDCDNIIDNQPGSSTPYSLPGCTTCVPSAEICDGCDNDCDGVADNGVSDIPCGIPAGPGEPAYCLGKQTCKTAQAVSSAGACLPGGPSNFRNACDVVGQPEICNGLDDDCNGIVDDGIPAVPCDVPGQPGLDYGPKSACKRGQQACNGVCTGWVGPSPEVCDGIDNDCKGGVDDGTLPGVGNQCGSAIPPCTKGQTACIDGALQCSGGTREQPETCNGIDDDCSGTIDDNLTDAPVGVNKNCWTLPGSSCNFLGKVTWTPPTGATCTGTGTLTTPCQTGQIACVQGGWTCLGGTLPGPEVCDGEDNDCNGQKDEGFVPQPCGTDVGECQAGSTSCTGGKITCNGEVGPTPEKCDGLDNDCNGKVDDGLPVNVNDKCNPVFDTTKFPHTPVDMTGTGAIGECKLGVAQCDGDGGFNCLGAVGPTPEICDGKDNDCDGKIDEIEDPDGIQGTANPFDATQHIGDPCGSSVGACRPGNWTCVQGGFQCIGGKGPQPEICDCEDNDCNGKVDEDTGDAGATPICGSSSPMKTCVAYKGTCQCAQPCGSHEFDSCPAGPFSCEAVTKSGTGESAGPLCVQDPESFCGDCTKKTVGVKLDAGFQVECAPAGAIDGGTYPVCVCKGQLGCHSPCSGITCAQMDGGGSVLCADFGPNAGRCVADNCFNIPCASGKLCVNFACTSDPCAGKACGNNEVCRPSADFATATCEKSCAAVTCPGGQSCLHGSCVPSPCNGTCGSGQVCSGALDAGMDAGDGGATCIASRCAAEGGTCPSGGCCDPATGVCGTCPCTGVRCPSGQVCQNDECVVPTSTDAGSDAMATADSARPEGGTDGGQAGGPTEGPKENPLGRFGLTTGGGGCQCEVGTQGSRGSPAWLFALGALVMLGRRQKPRPARGPRRSAPGGAS